jgi:hypothetical protein
MNFVYVLLQLGCAANNIQVGQKSATFSSGLNKTVYEFLIQTNPLNPGTLIALIDFGRNVSSSTVQFSGGVRTDIISTYSLIHDYNIRCKTISYT